METPHFLTGANSNDKPYLQSKELEMIEENP
jgi:hypothetical protein